MSSFESPDHYREKHGRVNKALYIATPDCHKCVTRITLSSVCEYAKVGYHNRFSEAFEGSIKATDSSNDQKSLLETKRKRTHSSFAVISLKPFLEDLKSERK